MITLTSHATVPCPIPTIHLEKHHQVADGWAISPASIWPWDWWISSVPATTEPPISWLLRPNRNGGFTQQQWGWGQANKNRDLMFLHHQLDMIFGCIPFPKSPSLKGKRLGSIMKQRILGHTIFGQTHTVYTTINGDKSSNTW